MTCMFLKEADKIGRVFITQHIRYFLHLLRGGQEVSFCFEKYMFLYKGGGGFAHHGFSDTVELIGGEAHEAGIIRYLFMSGIMLLQQGGELAKTILGIGCRGWIVMISCFR